MFLIPTKSQVFKFSPYKFLMVILVLRNIVVCKIVFILKTFYKKWKLLVLQNNPCKM